MNRLTKVESSSVLIKDGWKKKDTESYTSICYGCEEIRKCVNKCGFYKALEKLADYEDTGLEPEKIQQLNDAFINSQKKLEKTFDELFKYKDLEEQGLLIKLPCKVGEVVYEANIGRKIVAVYKVTSVTIMTHSRNYGWELVEGIYSNLLGFNEFALGKTVFLTREEAEKALKEREVK